MKKLLLIHTFQDKPYLPRFKECLGATACLLFGETISSRTEIIRLAERAQTPQILCTSVAILKILLNTDGVKNPSLDNYAGSLFNLHSEKLGKLEILFLNPLEHLVSVSYGKFILRRYLSKFISPDLWLPAPEFIWTELDETNFSQILASYTTANLIALDIETGKEPYIHIWQLPVY